MLIILLVLALIGCLPTWRYSRGWGHYPSGVVGLIVLILVILLLLGLRSVLTWKVLRKNRAGLCGC
jgi:hypothetical protein